MEGNNSGPDKRKAVKAVRGGPTSCLILIDRATIDRAAKRVHASLGPILDLRALSFLQTGETLTDEQSTPAVVLAMEEGLRDQIEG